MQTRNPIEVVAGQGRLAVHVRASFLGEDLVVELGGGSRPHVGAVAVSVARPSQTDRTKVSGTPNLITLSGHKEDQIAIEAALGLTAKTRRTTVVIAGMHVDGANNEEINALVDNARSALNQIGANLAEIL